MATVDGKAYYTITELLRKITTQYTNLTPGEKVNPSIRLVLTTRKERGLIPSSAVLCVEDLGNNPSVAKQKIISFLHKEQEDSLLIGVDPGGRIGIVAYYKNNEVFGDVVNSVVAAEETVTSLIKSSSAKRKVLRIGDGKPDLARRIAEDLLRRVGSDVKIELVDEKGTSSLSKMKLNGKGLRDQRSAKLIAFREGRKFPPA